MQSLQLEVSDSLRESAARAHVAAEIPREAAGKPLIRARHAVRDLSARHPRLAAAILAMFLGLAGLAGTPPVDRDEPQFAQPARQMLTSGDFIDIRFQRAPLAQKPVLTYWLEAASAGIFGREGADIWAYRLPSVLGLLIATLLTFQLAAALFGIEAALPAALLLATSLLAQSQAHQARADALLLAEMAAVTLPLARAHLAAGPGSYRHEAALAAMFWIGLAASILTKGPVVPAIVLVAVVVLGGLRRDVRWLRRLHAGWGIALCLLVLLPWPVAVIWLRGPSLFVHAWQTDILPKMISGQESHGAPPLSYLATSPLTLWPASFLLPAAVEYAWRRRREAAAIFCAAVIIPGWMLFEAAPTKLPHYIMPFLPLLAALMAASCVSSPERPSLTACRLGAVFLTLGAAGVSGATALALLRLGRGLDAPAMVLLAALAATAACATVTAWSGRLASALRPALLCGTIASLAVFGFALPRLDLLWVAARAAQAARAAAPAPARIVVAGYDEPSLVFLLGTGTRFERGAAAAAAIGTRAAAAAIVSTQESPAFLAGARGRHLLLRRVADVRGIDPVHGRDVELRVWTAPSCWSAERAAIRASCGRRRE